MKNLSLFILSVVCFTSGLFAQKGIEFGVNVTPTSPWILNDEDFAEGPDLDFRFNYGINFGATVGFNFTDNFGIATGITYVSGGQRYITAYENTAKADQITSRIDLRYMRVPVLFKFNGDINAATSAFFRIGPHFDFLQKATYTIDNAPIVGKVERDFLNDSTYNNQKIYNKNVIGLTLEMGSQFKIADNLKFVLAFQLAGSLNNIEGEDAKRNFATSGSILNRERSKAWHVSAGINLGVTYVIGL